MNKALRRAKEASNVQAVTHLGVTLIKQQEGVHRVETPVGTVIYYPSSDQWQYKGRLKKGNPKQFVVVVKALLATRYVNIALKECA